MDKRSVSPLRRFLPNNLISMGDLYRNEDVLNLFQTYCPLLMREARRCLDAKTPDKNLIALFGFTIHGEWLTSVFLSLRQVEKILKKSGLRPEEMPYLAQVKEKWGELRIYLGLEDGIFPRDGFPADKEINDVILRLERRYAKE